MICCGQLDRCSATGPCEMCSVANRDKIQPLTDRDVGVVDKRTVEELAREGNGGKEWLVEDDREEERES